MKNTLTIYDIAEKTGLSVSTVSCAINRRPTISKETTETVLKAMKDLNYTPPPPGKRRGLRSARRSLKGAKITLFISEMKKPVLASPVFMSVQSGVESSISEQGASLILSSHRSEGQPAGVIVPKDTDGVLIFGKVEDKRAMRELRNFPCVQMMGKMVDHDFWDHVTYDNSSIGRTAASYLLGRGFKNCSFIGNRDKATIFGERGASFADAIEQAGGQVKFHSDENAIKITDEVHEINFEVVEKIVSAILKDGKCSAALFSPADIYTSVIYPMLLMRGIVPGFKMEIVTCNNEQPYLAPMNPKPAIIDIHAETIGKRAVEQLLWRITNPHAPRVKTAIQPSLIEPERKFNVSLEKA